MSKVLMLADAHIGVPNRTSDIFWALRCAREYAKQNSIDTVLVLGDLFHDRQAIGVDTMCSAHNFLSDTKHKYGQNWVVFPGNHDMFLKHSWEVNSLIPFSGLITLINGIKCLKIEEVNFWILPFISSESAYMNVLSKLETKIGPDDVLLTHIGVRNASLNTCFLLDHWTVVDFSESKFKQVYTGHFHNYQQVGNNVWYPGSLIPFNFSEGDVEHGFLEYDLDTRTHKFVDIWECGADYFPEEAAPPQYNTLHDSLLAEKGSADVAGRALRVALTRDYTANEQAEMRAKLLEMGAKSVRFMNLSVDEPPQLSVAQANLLTADRLFEKFIEADEKGTAGLQHSLLKRMNLEIITEGDEIYNKSCD